MTSADLSKANLILSKIQAAVVDGLILESEVMADGEFQRMLSKVFKPHELMPESLSMILYDVKMAVLRGAVSLSDIEDNTRAVLSLIRYGKITRKTMEAAFISNLEPEAETE